MTPQCRKNDSAQNPKSLATSLQIDNLQGSSKNLNAVNTPTRVHLGLQKWARRKSTVTVLGQTQDRVHKYTFVVTEIYVLSALYTDMLQSGFAPYLNETNALNVKKIHDRQPVQSKVKKGHWRNASNDSNDQGITQRFKQFIRQAISTMVKHLGN